MGRIDRKEDALSSANQTMLCDAVRYVTIGCDVLQYNTI